MHTTSLRKMCKHFNSFYFWQKQKTSSHYEDFYIFHKNQYNSDGKCYAREFKEDSSFYIDEYGVLHAKSFVEGTVTNGFGEILSDYSLKVAELIEAAL